MNRKGFTLIELLAVIILIALIAVLIVPNIIDTMTKSKEASYQLLVKNIVTSAKTYYEECEYGDLSNRTKYGSYACSIDASSITIPLSSLANTGFLKVSDSKIENGTETGWIRNNILKRARNKKVFTNNEIEDYLQRLREQRNQIIDAYCIKNEDGTYSIPQNVREDIQPQNV